jgi:hypothetical protein
VVQAEQLNNPDARVSLGELESMDLLSHFANAYAGIQSGDYPRFGRCFWEMPKLLSGWVFQQSTVEGTQAYLVDGSTFCYGRMVKENWHKSPYGIYSRT